MDALIDVQAVAAEAFATLDTGRQIEPFSSRLSSFNLDDAYRVTAAVRKIRQTRGELPVGRKIGFTNRTIWAEYNVYEPVWGYVYDRTVHNLSEIGDTFLLVVSRAANRAGDRLQACGRASSGHGRKSIAREHRLGCAWFRNRAVDLSWMEVFRARHGRGVRSSRRAAHWASSFNLSARRRLGPDAFDLRNPI